MKHPCDFCGKPTSNKRFCSNLCSNRGTSSVRAAGIRKPRPTCPQCGVAEVMRGAVYCSRKCSDDAKRVTPDPCIRCGSTERRDRKRRGTYCSWYCYNEDRYTRIGGFATWTAKWFSGEISGTTADGRPDWHIKQVLVHLRGQRCEECGWDKINPLSGRVPLHVDHITGDRSRNRPDEVRLLCPNCHSLTSNYQHLNNPKVSPVRRNAGRRYRETWQSSTPQPGAR